MKLASGLGIVFSLITALVFGVILSESSRGMSLANERWQFISVGVILCCIVVFGVCAFLFARSNR